MEDVKNALTVFKLIVLTSPDLLIRDGKIIYKKVENEITEIFATTTTSKSKSYQLKNLKEFSLS
jgi:predicted RecB family nuclease